MAEKKPAKKGTQRSAKGTTGKAVKGFTAEERAAMREHAQEMKAGARRGPGAGTADEESAVREADSLGAPAILVTVDGRTVLAGGLE